MKLLFCPACNDVLKLRRMEMRHCDCGQSWGRYLVDGWHAEIGGKAMVIGVSNPTLATAVRKREDARGEFGPPLSAWLFPEDYQRITRLPVAPEDRAR